MRRSQCKMEFLDNTPPLQDTPFYLPISSSTKKQAVILSLAAWTGFVYSGWRSSLMGLQTGFCLYVMCGEGGCRSWRGEARLLLKHRDQEMQVLRRCSPYTLPRRCWVSTAGSRRCLTNRRQLFGKSCCRFNDGVQIHPLTIGKYVWTMVSPRAEKPMAEHEDFPRCCQMYRLKHCQTSWLWKTFLRSFRNTVIGAISGYLVSPILMSVYLIVFLPSTAGQPTRAL